MECKSPKRHELSSPDKKTDRFIEQIVSYRDGKRSLVLREAIQVYADMEGRLDKVEANPAFQAMMHKADKAIREGRFTSHDDVLRMLRKRSKRKSR